VDSYGTIELSFLFNSEIYNGGTMQALELVSEISTEIQFNVKFFFSFQNIYNCYRKMLNFYEGNQV